MLENIGLAVASLCVLSGGFFLYGSISSTDADQVARIIGGAALLLLA